MCKVGDTIRYIGKKESLIDSGLGLVDTVIGTGSGTIALVYFDKSKVKAKVQVDEIEVVRDNAVVYALTVDDYESAVDKVVGQLTRDLESWPLDFEPKLRLIRTFADVLGGELFDS